MKKVIYIIGVILGSFLISSCDRPDAQKDVKNAVDKLEYFNTTFEEYYADGIISVKKDNTGEFSQLRDIANEYYEMINKINTNVQEEQKKVKEGEKIFNYEETYKQNLSSLDERIKQQTAQFEKNLKILANIKKKR